MKRRVLSRPAAVPALTALLSALWWALLPAPPAWAHAQLLGSRPAAGSVVATTPATITLTFDGPVQQGYTTVVVAGPDGASRSDGAPTVVDGEVRQRVGPLPRGPIQVTWQTVAADGAPLQGRYTFTNSDSAATAVSSPQGTAPSATARASSPPARPVTSAGSRGAGDWPWWVAAGVLVASAGALLAVGLRRSAAARPGDRGPGG